MNLFSFFGRAAVAGLCLAGISSARAEVKLAAIFGDNMVFQQQQPVPVWGWSAPGAVVNVSFAGQNRKTQADASGRWLVKLGKLKAAAEPQTLVVTADTTVVRTNILVGEVWLASGQSNMEKPLGIQPGQKPTFNYEQTLAAADYPNLRLFHINKMLAATPADDLLKYQSWQACSSNSLQTMRFSAAAFYFGREIHTNLNVPVGLVESDWGGTRIEPWTPPAGFAQVKGLQALAVPGNFGTNPIPNTAPSVLYNAMIAPIAGFAIRGAIWYQGESNIKDSLTHPNYADKMAALIGGWRQVWNEGDFPFYFVQIAPFKYYTGKIKRANTEDGLPLFWTIQSQAARKIKHTGMVVTTDLVNNLNDIHPRDKASVGHRLALLALDKTYDREVVSAGPVFHKVKFDDGRAILKFEHTDGGLISRDGQPLTWFTIAGADGKFVPAQAKIVGQTVEVSAPEVARAVAVRFAWSESAQPNLANGAGLPAEPFRTDSPE